MSYNQMMNVVNQRMLAVEQAHRIRRSTPGRPAPVVVFDKMRWSRDRSPWLLGNDADGFVRVTVTQSSEGEVSVLCPVNKLNNLPKGLKFSVQAVCPGCEELVGIPAVVYPDGTICLCPLDIPIILPA